MAKTRTTAEQEAWDAEHSFDYIVSIYAGGEHLRAAALAAEAKFSQKKLDDLVEQCPGILAHMPDDKGEVKDSGTVPGDPVGEAIQRDDPSPSGTPKNDGIDKPTLHPAPEQRSSFNRPLSQEPTKRK